MDKTTMTVIFLIIGIILFIFAIRGCEGGVPFDPCLENIASKAMEPVKVTLYQDLPAQYNPEGIYNCLLEHLVYVWEQEDFSCQVLEEMSTEWQMASIIGTVTDEKFQGKLVTCISETLGIEKEYSITVLKILQTLG